MSGRVEISESTELDGDEEPEDEDGGLRGRSGRDEDGRGEAGEGGDVELGDEDSRDEGAEDEAADGKGDVKGLLVKIRT